MKIKIEEIEKIIELSKKRITKKELATSLFPESKSQRSALECLKNLEQNKNRALLKLRGQRLAIYKLTGIKESDIII